MPPIHPGEGGASARFEPLALLLLRAEGVASSYIEGLRTPLADVAAAEVGDTSNATAACVADNLTAVRYALDGPGRTIAIEDIHEWHRRLMGPTGRLPEEMGGAFRTRPVLDRWDLTAQRILRPSPA